MTEEMKDYTGLLEMPGEEKEVIEKQPALQKSREYDLTTALLKAANFKNDKDSITEIEIQRNGEFMFSIHITPISDSDSRTARRKATTFMPNPHNRKLPPIEKDFNSAEFHSWIIYLATTEEDKQQIWNNPALKEQYNLVRPVESIDLLLQVGEKTAIVDKILEISGLESDPDEVSEEEYAKN